MSTLNQLTTEPPLDPNPTPSPDPENERRRRGGGYHRTNEQKMLHRAEMVRLMRRGWSKYQIAEHLGVSYQTVLKDWRKITADMAVEADEDAKTLRDRKLEEYAEVKKEAWEAWERSKRLAIQQTEESSTSPSGKVGTKKSRVVKNQAGDPRFLHQILQCLESERTLLNLDPVKQVGITANVINWDALAGVIGGASLDDQVERQIEAAVRGEEYLLPAPEPIEAETGVEGLTITRFPQPDGDTDRSTSPIPSSQESGGGVSSDGSPSVPVKKKWVYANVNGKRELVEDRSGL